MPDSPSQFDNSVQSLAPAQWSDRRILRLVALSTLIVSVIWHAPQLIGYISLRSHELVITLVLAMSLTYLLRPVVNSLQRVFGASHSGRAWATAIAFGLCGLVIWLFVLIGLKPVLADLRELWDLLPQSADARRELFFKWRDSLQQIITPYRDFFPGLDIESAIPRWFNQGALWLGDKLSHSISPGFIVELILVPVLVFYFLSDGPAIRAESRLLAPAAWRPRARRMLTHFDSVLDGYIRGQVIMCVIAWILTTLALWGLGVPHAVALGLVAGLTRAVPIIGPLLGGIPVISVCLVSTQRMDLTMILLVGFTAMHFIESKVLLPKVIGHEVDLHPVSVIVSILIGMKFFGFLGVFLAVPIAAVLKIVLAEWHIAQAQKMEQSGASPIDEQVVEEARKELKI